MCRDNQNKPFRESRRNFTNGRPAIVEPLLSKAKQCHSKTLYSYISIAVNEPLWHSSRSISAYFSLPFAPQFNGLLILTSLIALFSGVRSDSILPSIDPPLQRRQLFPIPQILAPHHSDRPRREGRRQLKLRSDLRRRFEGTRSGRLPADGGADGR